MAPTQSPSPPSEPDTSSGPLVAIERVAAAVDDLVPASDNVANEVFMDTSRRIRWAGPLFALCAVALAPWIVVVAVTLPSRVVSPNYDTAWVGYDVMLFLALASTAGSALRRSRYLGMAAAWSAALLVADAWFDVMTSPSGAARLESILMAAMVELPLAAICIWLAGHAQDIAEKRLTLLLAHLPTREGDVPDLRHRAQPDKEAVTP